MTKSKTLRRVLCHDARRLELSTLSSAAASPGSGQPNDKDVRKEICQICDAGRLHVHHRKWRQSQSVIGIPLLGIRK